MFMHFYAFMQEDTSLRSTLKSRWREELELFRTDHGLSQVELAGLLETSQSTLSRILNGKGEPRQRLRLRIATVLRAVPQASATKGWILSVAAAARESRAFFEIVDAALRLLNDNE